MKLIEAATDRLQRVVQTDGLSAGAGKRRCVARRALPENSRPDAAGKAIPASAATVVIRPGRITGAGSQSIVFGDPPIPAMEPDQT